LKWSATAECVDGCQRTGGMSGNRRTIGFPTEFSENQQMSEDVKFSQNY
jgi:hypothetical protein